MIDKSRDLDFDVANLLVCADFLKPHQLDKAYAACRDAGMPLSTILLGNRMVEPELFVAALQVTTEINEGRMPHQMGRTALYLMGNCRLSLEEAMDKLGVIPNTNPWQRSLGALAEKYAVPN